MPTGKHRKKTIPNSQLSKLSNKFKKNNKKIVFTYGTFDLIHSGHAKYLINAKKNGDILIVGVSSNKCKKEVKGKGFPLIDQVNRIEVLNNFDFVDYTTIVDDRNLLPILEKIKPDIFYTISTDWEKGERTKEEENFLKKINTSIIKSKPIGPFVSSSDLVERVADLKIKEIIEYFFGKINIDLAKGDWSKNKFSGLKTNIRDASLKFHSDIDANQKILKLADLETLVKKLRKDKKKIVLTSGTCDLIHAGHLRFYSKAKSCGDILILVIPSDRVVRKQKGKGRPIVNDESRAELMSFFHFIDYVLIFDSDNIFGLIEDINPSIFFTVKEDWNDVEKLFPKAILEKWKGEIVICPPQSTGLSSSKLIKKAAGMRVNQVFSEVLEEAKKSSALKG